MKWIVQNLKSHNKQLTEYLYEILFSVISKHLVNQMPVLIFFIFNC